MNKLAAAILSVSLTGCATSSAVSGPSNWDPVKVSEDRSFSYITVDSTSQDDTFLGLYAYSEEKCEILAVSTTVADDAFNPNQTGDASIDMRMRFDKHDIWYAKGKIKASNFESEDGTYYGMLAGMMKVNDPMLMEMSVSSRLLIGKDEKDGWTDDYNITGAANAIAEVLEACEGLEGEAWGTAPVWESNQSENEWGS